VNTILFMATTVHVPEDLLHRVDTRARALGVSRNRFIVTALEESLGTRDTWPPELVGMLRHPLPAGAARDLEESLAAVRGRRSNRRKAPTL
jgi:predicted transcriptional regulator